MIIRLVPGTNDQFNYLIAPMESTETRCLFFFYQKGEAYKKNSRILTLFGPGVSSMKVNDFVKLEPTINFMWPVSRLESRSSIQVIETTVT